jgi:hypothetical protein
VRKTHPEQAGAGGVGTAVDRQGPRRFSPRQLRREDQVCEMKIPEHRVATEAVKQMAIDHITKHHEILVFSQDYSVGMLIELLNKAEEMGLSVCAIHLEPDLYVKDDNGEEHLISNQLRNKMLLIFKEGGDE